MKHWLNSSNLINTTNTITKWLQFFVKIKYLYSEDDFLSPTMNARLWVIENKNPRHKRNFCIEFITIDPQYFSFSFVVKCKNKNNKKSYFSATERQINEGPSSRLPAFNHLPSFLCRNCYLRNVIDIGSKGTIYFINNRMKHDFILKCNTIVSDLSPFSLCLIKL